MVRRLLRVLLYGLLLLSVLSVAAAFWARSQLRGSLPQLDGSIPVSGLSAPVRVTRDALGIPTIQGRNRADVARATGFLHAQDRFFQMDLARRRAAGELAALVGPRALALDREIRIHRFRAEARQAVAMVPADQQSLLEAYTAGVNAGLASLKAPPFEYLVLRQDPAAWREEDTFLVVLSMFVTLQDTDGSYEATLATMHEVLPPAMFEFLNPKGSEWDSPVVGGAFPTAPIPGPDVYDLRRRRASKATPDFQPPHPNDLSRLHADDWQLGVERGEAAIGSNNFAVAGRLTADGAALLANDMHLGIRVPNTWYRAVFEWPDLSNPAEPQRIYGVSLPGVPAMVAGSNGHVAWGFTNTYADWSDLVLLETDPAQPTRYRTPDGWREFERFDEVFQIAGQPAQRESVRWTIWGPVLGADFKGRPRAYRWVAHSAERLAASVVPLESARTLEAAFDEANGLGTPGQNMVAADRSGRIGWTIYGAVPRRVGIDGVLPSSWADGTRGWNGWLAAVEYPRIIDPPGGRLWTANARVVDGEMLARLGDGGYEIGARAHIIRERLAAKERFTPRDLLAIQLDTQAQFLSRWRDLLIQTLASDATAEAPRRAALREVMERTWTGQASPDSAAYRFTRAFRDAVSERVMAFVLAECYEADRAFDYTTVRRREAAIWTLVTGQPYHLLDPQYGSWKDLLLAAIDFTIDEAARRGSSDLERDTWADFNVVAFRHPLSAAIPFASRWLDMPRANVPGDLYTPRVHWGSIGASERMIVSPGREAEGIMHMPTGQSGHPLSPFYANSHRAWIDGEATPFLPGEALHTIALTPP
jgi:penicillin G amidase